MHIYVDFFFNTDNVVHDLQLLESVDVGRDLEDSTVKLYTDFPLCKGLTHPTTPALFKDQLYIVSGLTIYDSIL